MWNVEWMTCKNIKMRNYTHNVVVTKSYQFALGIIDLYKILIHQRQEFVMSKQLLKAGTSVGANIREAQNAESKLDFIHKLFIAPKECDETLYWLELLHEANYLTAVEFDGVIADGRELLSIITSIIVSTKNILLHNS